MSERLKIGACLYDIKYSWWNRQHTELKEHLTCYLFKREQVKPCLTHSGHVILKEEDGNHSRRHDSMHNSSFSKPGAYVSHNATGPLTVRHRFRCYARSGRRLWQTRGAGDRRVYLQFLSVFKNVVFCLTWRHLTWRHLTWRHLTWHHLRQLIRLHTSVATQGFIPSVLSAVLRSV